ncbi:hypothetical protein G9C85_03105 [Halorubellus sp. JP-L1]|uniref:hypothetical protein n=1 Tax=Halorubellus sp. JP-L1 TaxID=2715753 RepID=UPI00140E0BEA|nr:hypothetical protein [Halorubellus sp. JP-L1]NHN40626.1 hypothetical protein [Halorubellus sp. JP-L1]
MRRRLLLATTTSAAVAVLAGCTNEQTPEPDTITLELDTTDSWSGTIRTDDGTENVNGQGETTIEWTQPLPSNVRASIKKGPRQNAELTATFYADGNPETTKTTTGAYSTLILTFTPGAN